MHLTPCPLYPFQHLQFYRWTKSLLGFPAFLEFMAVRDSSISVGCNGTALMVPSVNLRTAHKPLGRFHMENTQQNLDDVLNFYGSIIKFVPNKSPRREKGKPLTNTLSFDVFDTCSVHVEIESLSSNEGYFSNRALLKHVSQQKTHIHDMRWSQYLVLGPTFGGKKLGSTSDEPHCWMRGWAHLHNLRPARSSQFLVENGSINLSNMT